MKKVVFETDKADGKATIVLIADVHYGNPCFNLQRFEETLHWCEDNDAYLILNGDLIENNIVGSRGGSVFEQTCSIQEQIGYMVERLKPFAKRHRIVNITSGNHEERSSRDTNISPTQIMIGLLSQYDPTLPERYCPDGAYTFFKVKYKAYCKGDRPYRHSVFTIYNLHGQGGGLKIGNKVQKLDDLKNVVPAQIYLRSHTHEFEYHEGVYFDIQTHNSCDIKQEKCYFANNSSFLNYGGYASRGQMKPVPIVVPVFHLEAHRYHKSRGGIDNIVIERKISFETI